MTSRSSPMEILVGLFLVWIMYLVSAGLILDELSLALLIATAVALLSLPVGLTAEMSIVEAIEWIGAIGLLLIPVGLGIAFVLPIVQTMLAYTVGVPVSALLEVAAGVPFVTGTIAAGLVGSIVGGSLLIAWKTGPAVNWALSIRLVVFPLILIVVLIGCCIAIWRCIDVVVGVGLSSFGIGSNVSAVVATVVTGGLFVMFVYLEGTQTSIFVRDGDARPVTADEFPSLHAITTKIATQLDIPVPTIAITQRSVPEAITVGYRPRAVTLILSDGLIDTLDEPELEAVVAHELAHVANMDAMVMTAASVPRVFADGLANLVLDASGVEREYRGIGGPTGVIRETLVTAWRKGPQHLLWLAVLIIPVLTKVLSLPIINSLSRARESAADRTAATGLSSPEAMGSALRTLSEQFEELPSEDLREVSSHSSLSILPPNPIAWEFVREDAEGTEKVISFVLTTIVMLCIIGFLETHPPTDRRIEQLIALSGDMSA